MYRFEDSTLIFRKQHFNIAKIGKKEQIYKSINDFIALQILGSDE
jgi:hypothetical protein